MMWFITARWYRREKAEWARRLAAEQKRANVLRDKLEEDEL